MSENLTPNVGRLELNLAIQLNQSNYVEQKQATTAKGRPTEEPTTDQSKNNVEVQPDKKTSNPLLDTSLKFMVNAETKSVTLLILDRASHKVVRTIPPEDMNKLDPGEVLNLFA
jgi:uncharacterized FlaG/YvyC family protein